MAKQRRNPTFVPGPRSGPAWARATTLQVHEFRSASFGRQYGLSVDFTGPKPPAAVISAMREHYPAFGRLRPTSRSEWRSWYVVAPDWPTSESYLPRPLRDAGVRIPPAPDDAVPLPAGCDPFAQPSRLPPRPRRNPLSAQALHQATRAREAARVGDYAKAGMLYRQAAEVLWRTGGMEDERILLGLAKQAERQAGEKWDRVGNPKRKRRNPKVRSYAQAKYQAGQHKARTAERLARWHSGLPKVDYAPAQDSRGKDYGRRKPVAFWDRKVTERQIRRAEAQLKKERADVERSEKLAARLAARRNPPKPRTPAQSRYRRQQSSARWLHRDRSLVGYADLVDAPGRDSLLSREPTQRRRK